MPCPPCPSTPWHARLAPGDVVSFRFPVADPGRGARVKKRPCLVLEVRVVEGRRHALLAYGTSVRSRANRGREIRVRRPEGLAQAGLHRPTRFVGARSVTVPLDDPRFVVSAQTGSPVLGRLDADLRARMAEVCAAPLPETGAPGSASCRHAPPWGQYPPEIHATSS